MILNVPQPVWIGWWPDYVLYNGATSDCSMPSGTRPFYGRSAAESSVDIWQLAQLRLKPHVAHP